MERHLDDDMEGAFDTKSEASRPEIEMPPAAFSPFNCEMLRGWFFAVPRCRFEVPLSVVSLGTGPFTTDTLTPLFNQHNVFQYSARMFSEPILILGREGWDEEEVDAFVDRRVGQVLKVYSQEMFLAYLATGSDPFDAGPAVLEAFKAGHPGLEFVAEGWRGWVTTQVLVNRHTASSESMENTAWNKESPLHALGYQVGEKGGPAYERQRILRQAFEEPLPRVGPPSYVAEWGEPKTAKRLKKMAELIAANCRNMKKKRNPSEQAIEDWEEDLGWLCSTLYHGHFQFSWPDTTV
jgi:hypothetical protein